MSCEDQLHVLKGEPSAPSYLLRPATLKQLQHLPRTLSAFQSHSDFSADDVSDDGFERIAGPTVELLLLTVHCDDAALGFDVIPAFERLADEEFDSRWKGSARHMSGRLIAKLTPKIPCFLGHLFVLKLGEEVGESFLQIEL